MLHEFGFFKIDGVIVYHNKPVELQDMEQCTSTNSYDSAIQLNQDETYFDLGRKELYEETEKKG